MGSETQRNIFLAALAKIKEASKLDTPLTLAMFLEHPGFEETLTPGMVTLLGYLVYGDEEEMSAVERATGVRLSQAVQTVDKQCVDAAFELVSDLANSQRETQDSFLPRDSLVAYVRELLQ